MNVFTILPNGGLSLGRRRTWDMGAKEQQKYPAVAVQTERESESVEPSPETLMARIALNMR